MINTCNERLVFSVMHNVKNTSLGDKKMADIKNFGIKGLRHDVQMGKSGGFLNIRFRNLDPRFYTIQMVAH